MTSGSAVRRGVDCREDVSCDVIDYVTVAARAAVVRHARRGARRVGPRPHDPVFPSNALPENGECYRCIFNYLW